MSKMIIGDLVEIKTALGISYAQYTHKDLEFGSIIRVYDKIYDERPNDLAENIKDTSGFTVYFPVEESLRNEAFQLVGNYPVPAELVDFPLFRCGGVGPSGKVKTWWLWDGKEEVRIGDLSESQKSLPNRQIWNIVILLQRIESQWTWEMDPNI